LNRNRWIIVAAVLVVVLAGVWWKSRSAGAAPEVSHGRGRPGRRRECGLGHRHDPSGGPGRGRQPGERHGRQALRGLQLAGARGQVLLQLEQSSFRAREVQAEAAVARAEASVKDAERSLRRARRSCSRSKYSRSRTGRRGGGARACARPTSSRRVRSSSPPRWTCSTPPSAAPIDGVVISRSIDLGQTVAASLSAPTLFVIANDLSRMQSRPASTRPTSGQMRPGLPVVFTVDAFPRPGVRWPGRPVRLEPIVDQGCRDLHHGSSTPGTPTGDCARA